MKRYTGYFISGINFCFRYVIIAAIRSTRMSSVSNETRHVKRAVTIVSFFNNALLIFLMSFNMEFSDRFFNGEFSDFSKDWFSEVGYVIVSSLGFTSLYPLIEIILFGGLNKLKMAWDQRWICPKNLPDKTNCKSVSEY